MFRGSMVALATPLKNDEIDIERLRELVEFHIHAGTSAVIAAGTTGESGTLTHEEKLLVIKTVVDQAKERIPVIAGTAANATGACMELTQEAMSCGVDAVLVMTPAYIKPTQEGVYQHFTQVAQAVPVPIILYNVPSRTACDILPETVARLAKTSNIIGIKEATGDLLRLQHILEYCDGSLDVYSGDDLTAAAWILNGAKGVISVTANVAPRFMIKMCDSGLAGDNETCLGVQEKLMPLHQLMFIESNPIPVKWALHRMGLMSSEIRLPLTTLTLEHQYKLENCLKDYTEVDCENCDYN